MTARHSLIAIATVQGRHAAPVPTRLSEDVSKACAIAVPDDSIRDERQLDSILQQAPTQVDVLGRWQLGVKAAGLDKEIPADAESCIPPKTEAIQTVHPSHRPAPGEAGCVVPIRR